MSLTFNEHRLQLWPAMMLLAGADNRASFGSILKLVVDCLRPYTFRSDRDIDLIELKPPTSAETVLRWIDSIWRRMQSAEKSELIATRRTIFEEIVAAPLGSGEQSRLIAALDYLFRLCAARNVARNSGAGDLARIPRTGNSLMQAAYQSLGGLAATDLPVWIAGESGTELERLARLVHQLRGLPDSAFHLWDSGRPWSTALREPVSEPGPDATIFVHRVHEFPESFQKALYRHLMEELSCAPSFRVVVSSEPPEPSIAQVSGIIPELFAFLTPMRVDIPPLRNRTEDIPELMRFLAASSTEDDPVARFNPQALEALHAYHWPGNVTELEVALTFALKRRPSGAIRLQDLPETISPKMRAPAVLVTALEEILKNEGFRLFRSDEGRRTLATFLTDHHDRTFGAGDVQRLFKMGRETARRLLAALKQGGIIEGITGAEGKRVTRYRIRGRG